MERPRYLVVLLGACGLLLCGCVSSSGVFSSGKDTYTVVTSTPGAMASKAALMKRAYKEANAFCEDSGKVMQPTAYHFTDLYYELTFRALDPDDPDYRPPELEPWPDVKVDVKSN